MKMSKKGFTAMILSLLLLLVCLPAAVFGEGSSESTQEISITNTPIKGKILLEKTGEVLTGFVEKPNLKGILSRNQRVYMPEQALFAYCATADALKAAFQKHMSDPDVKMDDLGKELGMSRVQLYRKVKALTGISPVELLREMRLQRGYTLITTTTKSISEIAFEVGFHTPSYFSNCFKKQFNQYPTELREGA